MPPVARVWLGTRFKCEQDPQCLPSGSLLSSPQLLAGTMSLSMTGDSTCPQNHLLWVAGAGGLPLSAGLPAQNVIL